MIKKIIIIIVFLNNLVNAVDNECPYNLIKNYNNDSDNIFCIYNCCIPCPAQNYFYKENNIENDFYKINILRNISSILSFVVLIEYIFIIKKTNMKIKENKNNITEIRKLMIERNLNIIIICLSLSIFLFCSVSFFAIKDAKYLQCKNSITSSTQNNNKLCAIQGGILVFSSFSVVIWIFVLILISFCIMLSKAIIKLQIIILII